VVITVIPSHRSSLDVALADWPLLVFIGLFFFSPFHLPHVSSSSPPIITVMMASHATAVVLVIVCVVLVLLPSDAESLFASQAHLEHVHVSATIDHDSHVRVRKNLVFHSTPQFWYAFEDLSAQVNDGIGILGVVEDDRAFHEKPPSLYTHTPDSYEVLETPDSVLVYYYFEPSDKPLRNFTITYVMRNAVQVNMHEDEPYVLNLQV
jgi:hypothetical protein